MADVSVIIPCYNARDFIAQTIQSVLAQSQPVRELIVVDDGSTDDSAAIVEQCAEQAQAPVTLVRQKNAGESAARNAGIERAAGAFIAFLDSDDVWLANKIAEQMQTLTQHPGAIAAHTRVFNFGAALDDMGRSETERTKDDPSVEDLIDYHYISPSTALVRRAAFTEHGVRFDEQVRHSEDMLFFADLRLAGPLRLTDAPLVGKRKHAQQQSQASGHTILSYESRVNWCRQRAAALGPDRAAAMEQHLAQKMVAYLEDCYWRRQVAGLAEARRRVARLFPDQVAANPVVNRHIYPRWVYRLRDKLARV